MYELAERNDASFDLAQIAESILRVALYDLEFQRAVVFLGRDGSGYDVFAFDGYFEDDERAAIAG